MKEAAILSSGNEPTCGAVRKTHVACHLEFWNLGFLWWLRSLKMPQPLAWCRDLLVDMPGRRIWRLCPGDLKGHPSDLGD